VGHRSPSGKTWRECQAHWRVIVAPCGIAVRAAKHGRSGEAYLRVMVAMWGIAASSRVV
jgi:hypothetical protein